MSFKESAEYILKKCYEISLTKPLLNCKQKDFIDFVIDNTHKTYKYILFTAVLAKATDSKINALCLQKQSTLPGAYDARSLCHQVIVPFEIEVLDRALGGSNEPFLNKPARFPELSMTNAVRKGNDRLILESLIKNLPKIKNSEEAIQALLYLLSKLIYIRQQQKSLTQFTIKDSSNLPSKLMHFIDIALNKNIEGEVLTLLVAGVYHLRFSNESYLVEVHPVNQCGASSKEISDLDIYMNGNLFLSNELKDKSYSETDVRHATDKVIFSGGTRMIFIEGPRGVALSNFKENLQQEYLSKNFLLEIVPCKIFFETMVSTIELDCHEFIKYILDVAKKNKFKDETINYINELAVKEFGLIR